MTPIGYVVLTVYYAFFFWCLPSLSVSSIRKYPLDYLKVVLVFHSCAVAIALMIWGLTSLSVVQNWLHLSR